METARLTSHPLYVVPRVVWRPVLEIAQLVRHLREATEHVRCQVREFAKLVLRMLDEGPLQMTKMHARSQVELVFGSLTFSLASGVVYARAGSELPH